MRRAFGIILLIVFFCALSCCSKKKTTFMDKEHEASAVEQTDQEPLVMTEKEVPQIEPEVAESMAPDQGPTSFGPSEIQELLNIEENSNTLRQAEEIKMNRTVEGKLQIVSPKEVEWGDDFVVIVKIAKDTIVTEIYKEDVQILNKRVPITHQMSVNLFCYPTDAIDIHPVNSGDQIIEETGETSWRWNCKAQRTGEIELHVIISKVFENGKKEVAQKETLTVKSNPIKMVGNFFSKNYQWLFSTLVIPIFLWIRSRRRRKNERQDIT